MQTLTASPAADGRGNLAVLQAGRGLAALLVVLFHATGLVAAPEYWARPVLGGFFAFGFAGVNFFFALSGFIMMLIHQRDIGRLDRLRSYLVKRVARIYPIYWLVTAGVFALYLVTGNDRVSLIGNSILLVGPDAEAILGVAWTLFHEILFYAMFAVLIVSGRVGLAVLGVWFLLCTLWIAGEPPHYALASINIVFAFGVIAARLRDGVRWPRLLVVASAIGFLLVGLDVIGPKLMSGQVRDLLFGLFSAIGIAAAVRGETAGKVRAWRWLTHLGDASYSLYLVHYPVMAIAARVVLASPLRALPAEAAFVLLVGICVITGFATHLLVERPLQRWLRRHVEGSRSVAR